MPGGWWAIVGLHKVSKLDIRCAYINWQRVILIDWTRTHQDNNTNSTMKNNKKDRRLTTPGLPAIMRGGHYCSLENRNLNKAGGDRCGCCRYGGLLLAVAGCSCWGRAKSPPSEAKRMGAEGGKARCQKAGDGGRSVVRNGGRGGGEGIECWGRCEQKEEVVRSSGQC